MKKRLFIGLIFLALLLLAALGTIIEHGEATDAFHDRRSPAARSCRAEPLGDARLDGGLQPLRRRDYFVIWNVAEPSIGPYLISERGP